MGAALAQASMTLCLAKHRKGSIFLQKNVRIEVFSGLQEHEVRSNLCLIPICQATHLLILHLTNPVKSYTVTVTTLLAAFASGILLFHSEVRIWKKE